MITCGHFPWMPGERGGDASGNMEHAISAIHCKERHESMHFKIKKAKYLSVRLCSHGCAFAWFFHRGFLFSSGFGDVSSHASGATKEPDRSNDWTKTASFLPKYSSQARRLPHQPIAGTEPKSVLTAKRRAGTHKMWQSCRRKEISSKKLSPSWAEFGKWRNWPRRKWDAEYNAPVLRWMGTRAMTTEPRRLHQSQVPVPTSGEKEEEGEVMELEERGGYGQWETKQQQQQQQQLLLGVPFISHKTWVDWSGLLTG